MQHKRIWNRLYRLFITKENVKDKVRKISSHNLNLFTHISMKKRFPILHNTTANQRTKRTWYSHNKPSNFPRSQLARPYNLPILKHIVLHLQRRHPIHFWMPKYRIRSPNQTTGSMYSRTSSTCQRRNTIYSSCYTHFDPKPNLHPMFNTLCPGVPKFQ